MENNSFQTSFIPKKPLVASTDIPTTVSRPLGLLNFLSILSVVIVVALYGGLFVYKNILLKNLNNLHTSLQSSQESFEKDTIEDLQLFDKRMSVSKQVISGHIIFSPFFELMNQLTLPNVQFTKFEQTSSVDGRSFLVNMSGIARDYRSIALQAQVLNSDKGKYFKDVVFSNLGLADEKDKKGYVKFEISFSVDPTLLSYEKFVLQEGGKKSPVNTVPNADINNINLNTSVSVPTDNTSSNTAPVSTAPVTNTTTTPDTKSVTPSKTIINPKQ
jgi:hypothetical protein